MCRNLSVQEFILSVQEFRLSMRELFCIRTSSFHQEYLSLRANFLFAVQVCFDTNNSEDLSHQSFEVNVLVMAIEEYGDDVR